MRKIIHNYLFLSAFGNFLTFVSSIRFGDSSGFVKYRIAVGDIFQAENRHIFHIEQRIDFLIRKKMPVIFQIYRDNLGRQFDSQNAFDLPEQSFRLGGFDFITAMLAAVGFFRRLLKAFTASDRALAVYGNIHHNQININPRISET